LKRLSIWRIIRPLYDLRVGKPGMPPLFDPMARKWSNQNLPGALHFVTGNLLDRNPIFKRDDCCQTLVNVCSDLLKEWPCKLIAYVFMPEIFTWW
jgi:hypothetical protein